MSGNTVSGNGAGTTGSNSGASAASGIIGSAAGGILNPGPVAGFALGLIPGYDLFQALQNPDSAAFDYLVGAVGVLGPVGKGVGLALKEARVLGEAAKGADNFVNLASSARRRHILDGEVLPNGRYSGGHRGGTGFPGKSEFPCGWSDDKTMHHISDVATDPLSVTRAGRGGDIFARGTREGVDIEVLIRRGEIRTGYPVNVPRNP